MEKIKNCVAKNKKLVKSAAVFIIVILIIIFVGSVSFSYDDNSFTVDGAFVGSKTIQFDDVLNVDIVDNISLGLRKTGIETGKVKCGDFDNSTYGIYRLYVYKSTEKYIIVSHSGGILVFNLSTDEKTREAYSAIVANSHYALDKKG